MFGIDDVLLNVGGNLLAGALNNSAASDRQSTAQDYSAQQYASRYQTTVKDMAAAGLNPMMAYAGIGGSFPTSSAASSSGYGDIGSGYTQAKIASANVANINADTANKRAQADLIQSQIGQTNASAAQSSASVNQINAQVDKIREEIKNIPYEGNRIRAAAEQLINHGDLMFQQGATQRVVREELQAIIAKLKAETGLINFDLDAVKRMDNIGGVVKQVRPAVDLVRSLLRR